MVKCIIAGLFVIFGIIYFNCKIDKINNNSSHSNRKILWNHLVNKYHLIVLAGSCNPSHIKIFEEVVDDIGDEIVLILSTYVIGGSNKLIFECFTRVGADNDAIIESHRLVKTYDDIVPEFYDDFYRIKEVVKTKGVKSYLNEGVN